jgi:hypothetical protein
MNDGDEQGLILKIGAAGGSLSVWSVNAKDGTRSFLVKQDESTLKEFMTKEDAAGITFKSKTGPLRTFADALAVLGRYSWHLLYPVFVHQDFIDLVLKAVVNRGGEKEAIRWRHKLNLSLPSDDEETPPGKGKKITYASWSEFEEKESSKDPLRKSFMPIAKNVHELIISTFKENKMPFAVRYGGGTFSFSVPEVLAKSKKRTCVRFGLVNFKMNSTYFDSLYKDAADELPKGATLMKKEDPIRYGYGFASLNDLETVKQDLKKGILKSYRYLSKT